MINTQSTHSMIGIDVSKDKLDIYILDKEQARHIDNQDKAIRTFAKELKKDHPTALVVLENTGGYEKKARRIFGECGVPVHVAHANRIYHFGKQKSYFAKTDNIDAKLIARFGAQESVEPTAEYDKDTEALREITYRRNQLVEQIIAEKNRLKEDMCSFMKKSIKRTIKHLQREQVLSEQELEQYIERNEALKLKVNRLKTFKGVGPAVAHALVALVPELGTVNRASIACLVGVAPRNYDSGKKQKYRATQGGRFYVRRMLYMSALVCIRHNLNLKAFYERLLNQGKKKLVALTAVMRKIIITLNSMLQHGRDYEPTPMLL